MEIVSVLVAALAGFAMGAVWYMVLSKPWIAAAEIPVDENGRPVGQFNPMPFVVAGVTMLLVAGMMRHIFAMAAIDTWDKGVVSGLGIGLFMVAPWTAMNYAYAGRKRMLALLDGGYAVLGCGIIGLVLGLL